MKFEAVQGKQFAQEWTETSGVSGNSGTTLEFLSPFLWRAPPLEMRRERREFFRDHAGNGSFLSSYEVETGLLWMLAGLSCFLSSGDGYVGELLLLQQGCEGPFGRSRVCVRLPSRNLSGNGPHLAWRGEHPRFLELWQVLSTYDGELSDPLWRPQERPVPMRGSRGPLGIPLPWMLGPKTLCVVGTGI